MTESAQQYGYVYVTNGRVVTMYAETREEADKFFMEKFGFAPTEVNFVERKHT